MKENTMVTERLCYTLEETEAYLAKILQDRISESHVAITVKRLGGYRLVMVDNQQHEPTSL